jgi:hypothetical protein
MVTTDIQNVVRIEIREILESVDINWRCILIHTADQGVIEIVVHAQDPDNIKISF